MRRAINQPALIESTTDATQGIQRNPDQDEPSEPAAECGSKGFCICAHLSNYLTNGTLPTIENLYVNIDKNKPGERMAQFAGVIELFSRALTRRGHSF
jgi:hypothetical protein